MEVDKRKKILLVDDDEVQHQIAENMLKEEYTIIKASSGKEALDYLYNGNFVPNLILLDIMMPEMDGWEVFSRIKALSLLKNVPIVFLTALSATTEEKRAYDMGAAGFIIKSTDKETLMERIKKILGE